MASELHIVKIPDPAYHQDITILVGPFRKARKWVLKRFDCHWERVGRSGQFSCFTRNDPAYRWRVIWLQGWDGADTCQNALGHELLHCVASIARQFNLKLGGRNEEACCYLWSDLLEAAQTALNSAVANGEPNA